MTNDISCDFPASIPPHVDLGDVQVLMYDTSVGEYSVRYKGELVGALMEHGCRECVSWVCDVGNNPDLHGTAANIGSAIHHVLTLAYYDDRFITGEWPQR